jgi:phage N-6-adenine-methyltransferase
MNKVVFSSKSNEWETPLSFYSEQDVKYHFTLDPCCTNDNHLCSKYYTKEDNGLLHTWKGERVFVNPPYGREIGKWVKKAYEESLEGTLIMLFIPSRTDTKWFHDFILGKADVNFLKGRFKFENRTFPSWRADGNFKKSPAPFPMLLAVYNKDAL